MLKHKAPIALKYYLYSFFSSLLQQKRKIATRDFFNSNALNEFKEIEAFDYPINNNLETFDDVDSTGLESFDSFGDNIPTENKPNLETFDEEPLKNSIESFEDEDKAVIYKKKNEIDLSNDILINKIAEMQGRPRNPDAEVLEFQPERPLDLSRDTYINEIAEREGFAKNPEAEMVDNSRGAPFERIVPFGDLSRDTYVNEVAARRGLPLNLDAEFVDMDPRSSRYFYRTHHLDS